MVLHLWHTCNSKISFCEGDLSNLNDQMFPRTIHEYESHEFSKLFEVLEPNYTHLFLSFNMLLEIEHRTSHLPNKQALCPSFLKNYKVSLKNRGLFVLGTPSLEGTGNFSFATSAPWQYRQVSAYRNYGCICLNPIHWCSKHSFTKSPGMIWSIFLSVDFSTLGLWV